MLHLFTDQVEAACVVCKGASVYTEDVFHQAVQTRGLREAVPQAHTAAAGGLLSDPEGMEFIHDCY